jgi:hypothetical protein
MLSVIGRSKEMGSDHVLLKFTRHDITEDLEFTMRVRSEAGMRCYTIFVDNAKSTELRMSAALVSIFWEWLLSKLPMMATTSAYVAKSKVWKVLSQP